MSDETERLPLTLLQANQVLEADKLLKIARDRYGLILDGVLAAAGIEKAEIVGGNVAGDSPFLTIKRPEEQKDAKPKKSRVGGR